MAVLASLVSATLAAELTEQVGSSRPIEVCRAMNTIVLEGSGTEAIYDADFTPGSQNNPRKGLNDPRIDTWFKHTFTIPNQGGQCCQITYARMTVVMRASGDALDGNDTIYIMSDGQPIGKPTLGGWVYGGGRGTPQPRNVAAGTVVRKDIVFDDASLAVLNAKGRVSLQIQDDTIVEKAALELRGCCLTMPLQTTSR